MQSVGESIGLASDVRGQARSVVEAKIAARADEFDAAEQIPDDVLDLVGERGWWGAALPREAGGGGMPWTAVGALHEEIGRACSSLRSLLTVHTMVSFAIERWGNAAQRARWLPQLANGHTLGAFCLTESEAGSDASAIAATATRTPGGFTLFGTKVWVTGGQRAGLYLVFARTDEGICAFLVPRDSPGITVTPVCGALGIRASMLASVTLADCPVDGDALLGPEGFALPTVVTGALDIGRFSVACGCVGIVQACLDACADRTSRRVHRDGFLKDQALVRRMLSDMVVDVRASRLLCDQAGRLKDGGDSATLMATWVAKYFAARAAARAASDAVQIHGAAGCAPGHRVGRYYRDAKVMEIIEGSNELQQLAIADDAYRPVLQ